MSERSERTSRSGVQEKIQFCSLSEGKPSEVYQKHNNCHFLNMHFNVSDPREGFFHISCQHTSTHTYTKYIQVV